MIHWDSTGTKGTVGRYEVLVIPHGEGWMPVIWVQKIHITSLPVEASKADAQIMATEFIEEFQKASDRHLDRIGYDR